MSKKILFTIGYALFTPDAFIGVLKQFAITTVADVRSQPYSRYKPDFSCRALETSLALHGIRYLFLGENCGARSKDPACYVNKRADYRLIAAGTLFREGLKQIRQSLEASVTALLCAENDPLMCHRNILVARNLKAPGLEIIHILHPGILEPNTQTEERLLQAAGIRQDELFADREELLAAAYDRVGERIAYRMQ